MSNVFYWKLSGMSIPLIFQMCFSFFSYCAQSLLRFFVIFSLFLNLFLSFFSICLIFKRKAERNPVEMTEHFLCKCQTVKFFPLSYDILYRWLPYIFCIYTWLYDKFLPKGDDCHAHKHYRLSVTPFFIFFQSHTKIKSSTTKEIELAFVDISGFEPT